MPATVEDDFIDLKYTLADLRAMYRRFIMMGFTPTQSGNLVAGLVGLKPSPKSPWTIKQIGNLLFVRATEK